MGELFDLLQRQVQSRDGVCDCSLLKEKQASKKTRETLTRVSAATLCCLVWRYLRRGVRGRGCERGVRRGIGRGGADGHLRIPRCFFRHVAVHLQTQMPVSITDEDL